jgi:hypothetical protein
LCCITRLSTFVEIPQYNELSLHLRR